MRFHGSPLRVTFGTPGVFDSSNNPRLSTENTVTRGQEPMIEEEAEVNITHPGVGSTHGVELQNEEGDAPKLEGKEEE